MGQVTQSLALDVRPSHRDKLVQLLADLRGPGRPDQTAANPAIIAALPPLHFFSICVLDSADYDPLLTIEANFDGQAGPFWGQLQAVLGESLRQMIRCCKRPRDGSRDLYDAIVAADSRRDPVPYLEYHVMRPRVFFHGARGMTRQRILAEAELATAAQAELGNGSGEWQKLAPEHIRLALRDALTPKFPWLGTPPPKRIPTSETVLYWLKLALLLFCALFLCIVPGLLTGSILTDRDHAPVLVLAALPAWLFLFSYRLPLSEIAASSKRGLVSVAGSNAIPVGVGLAVFFLASWPIVTLLVHWAWDFPFERAWPTAARLIGWGMAWMLLFMLPAVLIWIRYLERNDSSLAGPIDDPVTLRRMAGDEDWLPQNHMVSVVSMRPQILRRVLAYFVTAGVRLALQAIVKDGYLGSMRTIHFAHWAFVNNGSRMLFLSNYDFSWEAYFDDFIEKAHSGLTLIWGGSVGFPPTTMLIEDGAAQGRAFKGWARHSMAPTRFWVSAYPHITVDQIYRNNRIADGLRAASLNPADAATWIANL